MTKLQEILEELVSGITDKQYLKDGYGKALLNRALSAIEGLVPSEIEMANIIGDAQYSHRNYRGKLSESQYIANACREEMLRRFK
jgi:hypothetical protein